MNIPLRLFFSILFAISSLAAWTQPTLTFSPANGASGVPENIVITISSDEDLDRCDNTNITDTNVDALITLKRDNALGANISFDAVFDDGATNRIITITPSLLLPSNTVIFVEISCVEGNGNTDIPAPQNVSFTTGDTQTPVPTFTPLNGANNVSVSNDITISFNEAIRNIDDSPITAADIEGGLVELKLTNDAGAPVLFTATINGSNDLITINPTSNLTSSTLYYFEINPVEDAADNAITASNITFTTADVVPPTVTFNPVNAATGVSETANIVISFNELVRRASDDANLDNTNVDGRITLKLTNAAGANIAFDAAINAGDDQITIDPTAVLPSNSVIYVAVAGVEDASNNLISPDPQSITFTTGDTQPPVPTFTPTNGAVNVSVSNNLTIAFNEAIRKTDDSPITAADIEGGLVELKLTDDVGAPVLFTATINGSNDLITINPIANLSSSTLYYLEINPVEDVVNNATIATSITFTSADIIPPTVTFNPTNGATSINESSNIIISFSELVRRASDNANLDNTNVDGRITLKLTNAAGANIPFDATINAGDDQITIDPTSVLPSNSVIYVAVTGVEDGGDNLISPDPQSITFTTDDSISPTVSFNPTGGATNVSAVGNITIILNEPVRKLDDTPISAADLTTLVELKLTSDGGAAVGFSASIDGTNQIITVNPTATLLANQLYFVELNPVEDSFDNPTTLSNITFTTELAPSTPTFTPAATCIGDNVTVNGLRFYGTGSGPTGTAEPTVYVNGVAVPSANIVTFIATQVVFTLPTGASTGTITVRNNDSDLVSAASASTLTVYPAIDQTLTVTATPPAPAQTQSVTFLVNSPQSSYSYQLFLDAAPPPVVTGSKDTDSSDPVDLDGGTLSEAGFYDFRIEVSRAGCTTRNLNAALDFNVLALLADAGLDATICNGQSVVLGGSPPAVGGTGFNSFSWSPTTGLNCSTCPNPTASPTTTTIYTLTVTNNIGVVMNDMVTVTVNPTTVADFVVQAYPGQAAINPTETNFTIFTPADKPIILNGIVAVGDSTDGYFSGSGVSYKAIPNPINDNRYVFNPSTLNIGQYTITYTYVEPVTGCQSSHSKQFNIFSQAIIGLQGEYCANDNALKPLSVEPTLVPSYGTTVPDAFYIRYQSYKQATDVVNNGGTLTFTVPNHGLTAGGNYFIQAYYGFSGVDAPFGYISNNFVIFNVTQNTFDITANVTGNWDRTGSYIELPFPQVSGVPILNTATTVRITTTTPHGLQTGSRPFVYIDGISFDGGANCYGYRYDPVTVINSTTFDVNIPGGNIPCYGIYAYVNPYEYRISGGGFSPNMGPSLNSNLAGATNYEVGYFITENGCPYPYCTYAVNNQPVRINPLPGADFNTLALNYCYDDNTPVNLTGLGTLDGTYSASPNVGLIDGGAGSNGATFVPSTIGAPNVNNPILITYSVVDAKGCANSIQKTTTVRSLPVVNAGLDVFVCNDGGATSSITIGGTPTATGSVPLNFAWTPSTKLNSDVIANPVANPTVNTLYTVTVTDGFGCISSDDVQVTVNSPATVNAGPDDIDICSASPLDLTTLAGGNYGGTATEAFWGLTGAPMTGDFEDGIGPQYDFDDALTFTPTVLDVANRFVYIVLTTDDPPGPCPVAKDSVRITINATPGPPDIANTGTKDDILVLAGRNVSQVEYHCVTPGSAGAIPSLNAIGSGGSTIKWYNNPNYIGGVALNPFSTGITSLRDTLKIFYATQVDINGCEGTFRSDTLIINPAPLPDFLITKYCEGDFTEFNALPYSTVTYNNGNTGQITAFNWKFDDNAELTGLVGAPIPANQNHGGNTSGTFDNPSHRYASIGTYTVLLSAVTSDGCSNSIISANTTFGDGTTPPNQNLRIGKIPIANFNYVNICEGDNTQFDYLQAQNPAALDMKSWEWYSSTTSFTSIISDPTYSYSTYGTDSVTMVLTSNLDCVDSITKPVFILPYIQDFTNPYIESFESASHGWVHEGLALNFTTNTVPDSWNLSDLSANPGSVINAAADGGYAFLTRMDRGTPAADTTYFNDERSVLYGPCFDVTALPRPALSFAYWNNTQNESDGVYLETSIDGGNTWIPLGTNNTGLRWYNETSIGGLTSKPIEGGGGSIGQSLNQYGFTGNTNGWQVGKISLENFVTENKMRVRFVFGSNGDNPPREQLNGFAMDYFKLDSRNRVLLAENFTTVNENDNTNTVANNNTAFNQFKQSLTNNEVVKIQYNTTLMGADPINAQNSTDPNSRVAFYGITTSNNAIPRAYLDGYSQGNFLQTWVDNFYSTRSLEDAPFAINISTLATDPGTIEMAVNIDVELNMPLISRPIMRIAIVEKTVNPYEYVLRKLLPSAAGFPLYNVTNPNIPIVAGQPLPNPPPNFTWAIDNPNIDQTNLAVVVFIQDLNTSNEGFRPVYQTAIDISPIITPGVITGTEDPLYAEKINLFPNPANHMVNIELPAAVNRETPVVMFDTYGRAVYQNTFKEGEHRKSVNTSELTDGVYIVQIGTPDGGVARRKVMVVHR